MISGDEGRYGRSPHTAWQTMEDGGVILHLREHMLTATNATGAALWGWLEVPRTSRELSLLLAGEFEVSEEVALRTVLDFLRELQEKELVESTSGPRGAGNAGNG